MYVSVYDLNRKKVADNDSPKTQNGADYIMSEKSEFNDNYK